MRAETNHERLLAELPREWAIRDVSSLGNIAGGSTPSRDVGRFWGGEIPWVTPGEMTELRGQKYLLNTNEKITQSGYQSCGTRLLPQNALLVTTRATLGVVALAGCEVSTNQGFKSIAFSGSNVPDFYYHLFGRLKPEMERRASGTTFLEISSRDFGGMRVPQPPVVEQRAVAAVLDAVDDAIRKTEQIIAKLQQVKQGLLHDLLTRGIDDNGELRDPERHPEQFQDSPLGRIPRDWNSYPLLDVVDLPSGQVDPRFEPFSSMLLVAPDHIERNTGRLLSRATAKEQGAISGKYLFSEGDIIYSKIRPYLRKAVIADGPGLCSADMYPLRCRRDVALPEFLLILLLGENFSRFAENVSMRSGFPKINREELAEYCAYLPAIEEQECASDMVGRLDEKIQVENQLAAEMAMVKAGLAEDLLTGRVRTTSLPEVRP